MTEDKGLDEGNDFATPDLVPVKTIEGNLQFPLAAENRHCLVVEVLGIDPLVVEKASREWLAETGTFICAELTRIKRDALDPITACYQAHHFLDAVALFAGSPSAHLVLVEASPMARYPHDRFAHLQAEAVLLKEHNRFHFPLFHLGLGVFAFLVDKQPRAFLKDFCLTLITLLKRNGCRRVHCGCRSLGGGRSDDAIGLSDPKRAIDEAWQALERACGRGPFAFCDYETLANSEQPLFRPVCPRITAWLRHRCRGLASFALVCLRPGGRWTDERKRLLDESLGRYQSLVMDGDQVVILPERGGDEAYHWARQIIKEVVNASGECSLSAGISCYPDQGASIAVLLKNTLKALLHASFLEPNSVVVLDALSLNISGDAYFAEGDWFAAVKEYRQGLLWAEHDTNLLNSLGVTYTMLNRTSAAVESFRRVLAVDPDNFVACYNCGLGMQATGQFAEAVALFSRALEVYDENDADEKSVYGDLCYQYGVSLFKTGDHQRCVMALTRWYEEHKPSPAAGACCRYIGSSHYHLGHLTEAGHWLQRALTYDETDAESLSLLGAVYLKQGEGDDIALRLLEKAVEMTENKEVGLVLRWAQGLQACGHLEQALLQFRRCGAQKQTRSEVWQGLRDIYRQQGKDRLADRYQKKIAKA
ncbi:hypothetical protein [Desulfofustis limnaeus]|uniref:hypothetical protein n=1 Tax=Desulfofustis limnaeus TaxID=2740163 RepID=UPI0024DF9BDA|nr:hypothetical protein [Desulfofustis limnaeus]MDX9895719.1 hypothetical protein [Desulfofustis sp.]